jgi:RNA polymerase sigma-70 factor, ECF subfamily
VLDGAGSCRDNDAPVALKTTHHLTRMLRDLRSEDSSAAAQVAELIYPELRKLARACLARERPGHILQPTALVNETYLRLLGHRDHDWRNRAHFFAAAATTMRRILIDHARKRPPGTTTVLEDVAASQPAANASIDVLALDEALRELGHIAPNQARVVELRYFVGLTIAEVAEVLGQSPRTVDTHWLAARQWLHRRLTA